MPTKHELFEMIQKQNRMLQKMQRTLNQMQNPNQTTHQKAPTSPYSGYYQSDYHPDQLMRPSRTHRVPVPTKLAWQLNSHPKYAPNISQVEQWINHILLVADYYHQSITPLQLQTILTLLTSHQMQNHERYSHELATMGYQKQPSIMTVHGPLNVDLIQNIYKATFGANPILDTPIIDLVVNNEAMNTFDTYIPKYLNQNIFDYIQKINQKIMQIEDDPITMHHQLRSHTIQLIWDDSFIPEP